MRALTVAPTPKPDTNRESPHTRSLACEKTYALQSEDDDDGEENTETYEDISAWQLEFQDLLEEESDADDVFNILYLTGRSIDDALNESVSGEIPLFFTTCEWENAVTLR